MEIYRRIGGVSRGIFGFLGKRRFPSSRIPVEEGEWSRCVEVALR